ncbi:MAG: Holliday junction branch migration protein RuvA [Rhabdochlamydiaceae bacterium]
MIDYIKGVLVHSSLSKLVIEQNGIGYSFTIPLSTYQKLPHVGEIVKIYVYTVIREDSHQSFGFLTEDERHLCELLTTVSGIGAKTAINIMSKIDGTQLQIAIKNKDLHTLSKLPGIGKKTAERLVVELKDKIDVLAPNQSDVAPSHLFDGASKDAINALINLGYSPFQSQKIVTQILKESSSELSLSDLITLSLRSINQG